MFCYGSSYVTLLDDDPFPNLSDEDEHYKRCNVSAGAKYKVTLDFLNIQTMLMLWKLSSMILLKYIFIAYGYYVSLVILWP